MIFHFKRLQNHINLIKLWLSRAVVKQRPSTVVELFKDYKTDIKIEMK